MLSENLTLADNAGSLTNIGSTGSRQFNLVEYADGRTKRRYAASAATTPHEILISHQLVGSGFATRRRSVIRCDYRVQNQDTSVTGGIIPSCSAYLVLDRPHNMGSIITDAQMKSFAGYVIAIALDSTNIAGILNMEA